MLLAGWNVDASSAGHLGLQRRARAARAGRHGRDWPGCGMDACERWPRHEEKGSGWNHAGHARHRRAADARPRSPSPPAATASASRGDPSGPADLGPPRRQPRQARLHRSDPARRRRAARKHEAAGQLPPQRTPRGQAAHAARRLVGERAGRTLPTCMTAIDDPLHDREVGARDSTLDPDPHRRRPHRRGPAADHAGAAAGARAGA